MKIKSIVACCSIIILSFSCTNDDTNELQQTKNIDFLDEREYIEGLAYIYFDEGTALLIENDIAEGKIMTKSAELNNTVESLGISSMRRLFPNAGEYELRTRNEGLHRWYVVEYSPNIPHTKAESNLMMVPGVDFIEPVRSIRINDFNDFDTKLWGLNNTNNPGFDINVKPVWENYTVGNPDVIVSVVDGGVDLKHEDLATNCLTTDHYNSIDNNNVIVAESHGTHVAGTIAAVSNNDKGITGIAGGDFKNGKGGIKIMSCQIFKPASNGDIVSGNSAAAIKWGADHGAVISQNSWGYNYDVDKDGKFNSEELENARNAKIGEADRQAIEYFIKYAGCDNDGNQLPDSPMKGGVVIFAAGNEAMSNAAPANYPNVIAVGAIAPDGAKASFSNYGEWVDISAPGERIYSTYPDDSYANLQGTSMACPHVSGVAALIVSYFGGPGFTNDMLWDKLIGGSNKEILSYTNQIGGLLDAYGSFLYGEDIEVNPITDINVSTSSNNACLTWTVPSDTEGKHVYSSLILYDKDKEKIEKATAEDHSEVQSILCIHTMPEGETETFTIHGLDFESTYYLKSFARSYDRRYSDSSPIIELSTAANKAPVITCEPENNHKIKSSEKIIIEVSAYDPDGHFISIQYENGSSADNFTTTLDDKNIVTIVGKDAQEGDYTAKVIVQDEYGLTSIKNINYTILENRPPIKTSEINNTLVSKGDVFTINMRGHVSDPDGEELKYEVRVSDPKILYVTIKGNELIGTALGYGTCDVQIIAKDAKGESILFDFKVAVKDFDNQLDIYPNPVKDYLYISTLDNTSARILLKSSTGRALLDLTSDVSAFEPARIDMTANAPGQYQVTVEFGGQVFNRTIVKL